MKIATLVFFIIFAVGELLSHILQQSWISFICKPMLMMMLFFYLFWSAYKDWLDDESKMAVALFGAWLGDIFLMNGQNKLFFMLGIAGFLMMQLFYISAFRKSGQIYIPLTEEEEHQNRMVRAARKTGRPLKDANGHELPLFEMQVIKGFVERYKYAVIPFVLMGGALLWFILPKLDGWIMKIAIFGYAVALVSTVIAALNRGGRVPQNSFIMVLVGSILFMVSDMLIAINKFLIIDFPHSGLAIMGLYIPAQFLIIEGFLRQGKVKTP
jgi:uncharacterized membrane protein YhhN